MRFNEIVQPPKVGREFQHLEDLVFVEGSSGVRAALTALEHIAQGHEDVAIKWDGNPTIYWGREEDGTFVMVGKNGWGRNMSTTREDLERFILSSGKGEEWRATFAESMGIIFDLLQENTPSDFRGYVYGDLLYHPKNFVTEDVGHYRFTPNKVEYSVRIDSPLGEQMFASQLGIAAHSYHPSFGSKISQPIEFTEELNTSNVVVLGQTYVTHTPDLDRTKLEEAERWLHDHAKEIDRFLEPVKDLSDLRATIYRFVNKQSRAQQLDGINEGSFLGSLDELKVSESKQGKINSLVEQHPNALPAIFTLIGLLMEAKDDIINQLDTAESDVTAKTGDQVGGEGYIAHRNKLKLVPRFRWQPN